MKRSRRVKSSKVSAKDVKKIKTSPRVPPKSSPTEDETKATELVIDEKRQSGTLSSNDEDIEKDEEVKDIKPKICFDYCDVVARVTDTEGDDQSEIKIKEEILDDGNSIEIGEPKIHQEEIAIIVPTKTKHHTNVESDSLLFETTTDETDAQSNNFNSSMLELEDDDNSSSLIDDDTAAKNILSLSNNEDDNDDKSTATSIESFIDAYEQMICGMDKASQCSFMETYGFIMTFRYVYELPKQKRDKDSEQAINILLGRYTGIDSLDVLQVLLEALNIIEDLDEFHAFDLQPVDCILITFLQLKVCISFKDIAKVFKCEEKVAATCFYTTLKKIKKMLKSVIYWPSREETEMTIPKFFKPAYSNVRTIFTNVLVQTGEKAKQRYVIGFAPSGFVSFISSGYNADTYSEEKVFRMEKLRQRFERNQDALMVLNGFAIENLLGVSNFRVFRPPFIVKKVLPDNKTIVRENFALFKHVTETCSSLQKFQILSLQLKFPSAFVDEVLFSVCVCINYNVMFRNT